MTRAARRSALPLVVTLALFLVLVGLAAAAESDEDFELGLGTAVFFLGIAAWAVLQATVGSIIAWRRPGHRVGRLMQASGPLLIAVFIGYLGGAWRYVTAGADDLAGGLLAWIGSITILPTLFMAFPLLGVVFPDGRLPSRRFAWPLRAAIGAIVVTGLLYAVHRGPVDRELPMNPFGVLSFSNDVRELLNLISTVALIGGLGLAVASVITRWQRGDPVERAQLKWVLGAFAVTAVLFAISWAGPDDGPAEFLDALGALSANLIPVAIGIAVLRYRLYDIDRLVSRTVSWAIVTGTLVVGFAVLVVGLQALLGDVTQGSTLAVAASTLVAFASFQPLRRRVQAIVDRRFDRAHYDATRTAAHFADLVRDEVDLERLVAAFVSSADQAVRPTRSAVWLPSRSTR